MVATIGTIPALTEYQPGDLALTGDERVEITNTGSATTAASFQMKVSNVAKIAGVLPNSLPGPNDRMAYMTSGGSPRSTLVGNLGVLSQGALPAGGATGQVLGKLSNVAFNANWIGVNASSVIYVSKNGSDTNAGIYPWIPMLTIQAAVTAAEVLIAAGASAAVVNVTDAGVYVENLVQSTSVLLWAPAATLVGTITLNVGAFTHLQSHYASVNTSVMVDVISAAGDRSGYNAAIIDGRGATASLTGSTLFRNRSSGRILVANADVAMVPQDGVGVFDAVSAGGFGHLHFCFADLYLAGDRAIGAQVNNQTSNLIGYVDHILKFTPALANTIGLNVTHASAVLKLTASEIIADAAYTSTGTSTLYIACPRIQGTRTGTANLTITTPSAAAGQMLFAQNATSDPLWLTVSGALTAGAGGTTFLTAGAATTLNIATGAVVATSIATGSIVQANLANAAVGSTKIATGAVGSTQIATGGVLSTAIATAAVGNAQIRTAAALSVIGNFSTGATFAADITAPASIATATYGLVTNATSVAWGQVAEYLTTGRVYFVRNDGSDSNTGLGNSAASAFVTIQKAVNAVAALNANNFSVQILLANGTYTSGVSLLSYVGSQPVTIQGNTGTPSSCVINASTFGVIGTAVQGYYTIAGIRFVTNVTTQGSVYASEGTQMVLNNVDFGRAVGANHITVGRFASVIVNSNYTVSSSATLHWAADTDGVINANGVTVGITNGTQTFGTWAFATRAGGILAVGNTFNGTAICTRYSADLNSYISVGGANATYLPGNVAGATSSGGQYV
jgi:hypothetical protein